MERRLGGAQRDSGGGLREACAAASHQVSSLDGAIGQYCRSDRKLSLKLSRLGDQEFGMAFDNDFLILGMIGHSEVYSSQRQLASAAGLFMIRSCVMESYDMLRSATRNVE